MLRSLNRWSNVCAMLLAGLLVFVLTLHAPMAASMAPTGHHAHGHAGQASSHDRQVDHAGHHHDGASDSSALMKSCASYCGLAGVGVEVVILSDPGLGPLPCAGERMPEPACTHPVVPPPKPVLV